MSVEFSDSVGHYTDPTQKWAVGNYANISTLTVIAGAGRNGAALYLQHGNQGAYCNGLSITRFLTNQVTRYLGGALYFNAAHGWGDGNSGIMGMSESATTQVDVRLTATGFLFLTRNGTQIGSTASAPLSLGQYYYLELKVTVDPTAGVAELRVNGSVVITFTGNTRASANSYTNSVWFLSYTYTGTNAPWMRVCDVYAVNTLGTICTGYLGDVAVNVHLPSGDGSTQQYTQHVATWAASTLYPMGTTIVDSNGNCQRISAVTSDSKSGGGAPAWATVVGDPTVDNHVTWTCLGPQAAWMLVSETPSDEDSSYAADATVGHEQLYTFPPITGTEIKSIVAWPRARKDDASVRSIRAIAKSGGSTGDNGADLTMSTNYADYFALLEVDPATGAAWTVSGANAAAFGVKTTA